MNKILSLFLFSLLLSVGCAGTMQTARTNGEGNFQFGVEPGGIVGIGGNRDDLPAILPSFNISGRYGVSETIDIGARIGTLGYEIQSKFMFTNPADHGLAPSIFAIGGGFGDTGSFAALVHIPLLIGIPIGSSELTISPRLSPMISTASRATSASSSAFGLSGGGSVGFAARVGETFWILPEVSVQLPLLVAGSGSSDTSTAVKLGGGFINIGVGLLFGGREYWIGL